MRRPNVLLLAAALCQSSFSLLIPPNSLLTHTPAIHIEPDTDRSQTRLGDDLKTLRHKCLENDPRHPPFDLSKLPPPTEQVVDSVVGLEDDDDEPSLPVIIWHGLGDKAGSDGMKAVADLLGSVNPGTYVYEVSLGANGVGGNDDQRASFFGQVSAQIEEVCEKIGKDNILQTAPAVDMLGFSQGGLFLRGLIETCGNNLPHVRTLLTFGSPHNGIAKFQQCKDSGDWVCRAAEALVSTGGVFTSFVQDRVVPAQYFRDPRNLDTYLENSKWLPFVNNERNKRNASYAERLADVDDFVMVLFEDDETVVPKETAWFADVNLDNGKVTELRNRTIYQEDWIGLKKLDDKGALTFISVKGGHMRLKEKDLKKMFEEYFGPLDEDYVEDESEEDSFEDDFFELWEDEEYGWETDL